MNFHPTDFESTESKAYDVPNPNLKERFIIRFIDLEQSFSNIKILFH